MVELAKYTNQDWEAALAGLIPVVSAARPHASWATRDTVYQTARKNAKNLAEDIKTLEGEAGFIFTSGSGGEGLTQQSVSLLRRWHLAEHTPSLTAMSIFAIRNSGVNMPPEIVNAVLAGSVLGEVENSLPYHNNLHYKKVLLQMMRLITMHNSIYAGTEQAFDGPTIGKLILAACIHDLGHDGKGNTIKGLFEQGRLERRAFDLALPYFELCRMSETDLDDLKVMLLCTDVTPLGDPSNPVNQMKAAYRYHFHGQKKKMGPLNLDPELEALEKNPHLAMMCLILHEADIGTSAGLDYALTAYETSTYKKEMGEAQAYPQDVVDFLNDICQRQMLSDAGQRLFAANMARIFALAEKEISDGNHPFPQPGHSDFLLLHTSGDPANPSKTIN